MNITAKTLEEAITRACVEMGITSDQLEYDVIDKGSKGIFGIGAKPCTISAWKKDSVSRDQVKEKSRNQTFQQDVDQIKKQNKNKKEYEKNWGELSKKDKRGKRLLNNIPSEQFQKKEKAKVSGKSVSDKKTNKNPENNNISQEDINSGKNKGIKKEIRTRREKNTRKNTRTRNDSSAVSFRAEKEKKSVILTEDPRKRATNFLDSLFKSMNKRINIGCSYNEKNAELSVNLSGEDVNGLTEQNAQALDALQYLTFQVVNKRQTGYIRVKLDIDNFREKHKEDLEKLAFEIAEKVKENKRPMVMEPMNAYERRIIHSVLQAEEMVTTRSEGEEPYRHVVISPVKK